MRELTQSYLDHARADHRNALARKQLIEARKEYIESQSRAKVQVDSWFVCNGHVAVRAVKGTTKSQV